MRKLWASLFTSSSKHQRFMHIPAKQADRETKPDIYFSFWALLSWQQATFYMKNVHFIYYFIHRDTDENWNDYSAFLHCCSFEAIYSNKYFNIDVALATWYSSLLSVTPYSECSHLSGQYVPFRLSWCMTVKQAETSGQSPHYLYLYCESCVFLLFIFEAFFGYPIKRQVSYWVLPFQSCLSGVSSPRSQRQRSRTCWIRSSVHEVCSIFCIPFQQINYNIHKKDKRKTTRKSQNNHQSYTLFLWCGKPISVSLLSLQLSENFLLLLLPPRADHYCSLTDTTQSKRLDGDSSAKVHSKDIR